MKEGLRITLNYEFGTVDVYNDFIITVMKEGITVKPEYNQDLIDVAHNYFKGRLFGYITFRKNSYAVDPRIYLETSKIENLAGFAVVRPMENIVNTTDLEKKFLAKPFEQFSTTDAAIKWILNLVANR